MKKQYMVVLLASLCVLMSSCLYSMQTQEIEGGSAPSAKQRKIVPGLTREECALVLLELNIPRLAVPIDTNGGRLMITPNIVLQNYSVNMHEEQARSLSPQAVLPQQPVRNKRIRMQDVYSYTRCYASSCITREAIPALHQAIIDDNLDQLADLLESQSHDINDPSNVNYLYDESHSGLTALHIAARVGNVAAINLLVAYGATVNSLSAFKLTPLHEAVKCGHLDAVKSLISCGADVTIVDRYGRDPEFVARKRDSKGGPYIKQEIIQLLVAAKLKACQY